jgi:hypothetical protein
MTFQTDAPDATVYVGKLTMKAPCKIDLSRKKTYTVLITAPGRQSVQFEMKPYFDGISLGNLIYPGGSIGMLTDWLTGADKKFTKLKTIEMPHADLAARPAQPTLVLMWEHDGKLMTKEELRAEKMGGVAAAASGTVAPEAETKHVTPGG